MERSGPRFSNLKTFAHERCKNAAAKKVFFIDFFCICSRCLKVFLNHFLKSNIQTFQIFGILGEKLWKEMVSDMKTFAWKGCQISVQKKVFFSENFAFLAGFSQYRCYYPHWSRGALPPVCGIFYGKLALLGRDQQYLGCLPKPFHWLATCKVVLIILGPLGREVCQART